MESNENVRLMYQNRCEFCGKYGISKCGKCEAVYYCSKQHQVEHWPIHKKTCRKTGYSLQVPRTYTNPSPEKSSPSTNRNENKLCYCPVFLKKYCPTNLYAPVELDNLNETKDLNFQSNLKDACMEVINALNSRGICVLDRFMGTEYGHRILLEVQDLYKKRTFEKGKIIGGVVIESVRSDVMTWVTGREPECINIQCLLRKIDEMVDAINKMPDRGVLSEYKLLTRTKMMVACYPGNGTHYQTHVDNPEKDGRCITFIYYVNHNWNKEQGGVLRTYPTSPSQPFDIEPEFDRLVIFWSDRRVPHEVLPVYANRFAISLWYFDYDERETFKKRVLEKTKSS